MPGVRRLESCAELLGRDAFGVVVGPTAKRWPRPVKVAAAGIPARVHLADFPLDPRLQVTGLTLSPAQLAWAQRRVPEADLRGADFEHTDCLIAWGSNLPEQHPVIYWRLKSALEKRKFPVIVVDPRVTMLAQNAHIHLAITPGSDVLLYSAMLHVLLWEGLVRGLIHIGASTHPGPGLGGGSGFLAAKRLGA